VASDEDFTIDSSLGIGGWHTHVKTLYDIMDEYEGRGLRERCDYLSKRIELQGLTPDIIEEINSAMSFTGTRPPGYNKEMMGFVTETWSSIEAFIADHGNDTAQWIAKVMTGDDSLDSYHDDSQVYDFLDNNLSPPNEKMAWAYIASIGFDKIAELMDIEADDVEDQSLSDIAEALNDEGTDTLVMAANTAVSVGNQYGAEAEMSKSLERAINDIDWSNIPGQIMAPNGIHWSDGKTPAIFHVLTVEEVFAALPEVFRTGENFIQAFLGWKEKLVNVQEPHYGWSDFDINAANDAFRDDMPDLRPKDMQ
jgi:hypothetical protein